MDRTVIRPDARQLYDLASRSSQWLVCKMLLATVISAYMSW